MPRLPVTRARTAYLPLMLQPGGITRSSGNKRLADFAVAVGAARAAEQGAVLLADAELVRRDEAAFPQPLAVFLGAGLVGLEAPGGGGFDIQGKTLADQQLAEAGRSRPRPCRRRDAVSCRWGRRRDRRSGPGCRRSVWSVDRAPRSRRSSYRRARRCRADRRRDIDAVEPVGDIAQLQRAAVPDDGGGGRTLAGRK